MTIWEVKMNTNLLKEILEHETESAATIVTASENGPHIANTWNSYINMIDDHTLCIPAGGFIKTEDHLKANGKIMLSVSNPVIQGFEYPGTGVVVEGTGKIVYEGDMVEKCKEQFPWIRGVLVVTVNKVTQKI